MIKNLRDSKGRWKKGHINLYGWKKGYQPTSETRKKMSDSAKRRWQRERDKIIEAQNKGRSNPEYRKKRSKIAKEVNSRPEMRRLHSEVCKRNSRKMVEGWKNSPRWREAVTSDEHRRRQGKASRKRWRNPDYKKRVSESQREIWKDQKIREKHIIGLKKSWNEERRQELSSVMKNRWRDPDYRAKVEQGCKRAWENPEYRAKMVKEREARWQNPEYKQRVVKRIFEANNAKPNKAEKRVDSILDSLFPSEYRYVGDGSFILGGFCPDFMNVNGQKKLIELFGDYWHREDNPQDRISRFEEFGYQTLIIWEHELDGEGLTEKLQEFHLAVG